MHPSTCVHAGHGTGHALLRGMLNRPSDALEAVCADCGGVQQGMGPCGTCGSARTVSINVVSGIFGEDWRSSCFAPAERPRVLSLGGGVDSFAMLVRALERGEAPDVVAFVDVGAPGDPGEWPSTYRHVDEVVRPLCERQGIEFVRIDGERYPVRDARSLFAWMWERGQIPVAGPTRICTRIAKVERFECWLDDRYPGQEVEVWIGFEAGDEPRPNQRGRAVSRRARDRSMTPGSRARHRARRAAHPRSRRWYRNRHRGSRRR